MLQHLGKVHLEYVNSYNNNEGMPPITYLNICHLGHSRPIGQIRFCYNKTYSDDINMIRMEFDVWNATLIDSISSSSHDILESIIVLGFIWLCIDNNGIYKSPTMYMTTHSYREDSKKAKDITSMIIHILNNLGCSTTDNDKYVFPKYSYGSKICDLIKKENI